MATGIVAVAAFDHLYWRIGIALRALAGGMAVLLGVWAITYAVRRPRSLPSAIRRPDAALSMFTVVAACAVLAACWPAEHALGAWLDGVGLLGWIVLAPFAAVDLGSRPIGRLRAHAHGAWLLPSVATQGLAATTADVARHAGSSTLVLIAAVAWLLGFVGYLAGAVLIGSRALGAPVRPDSVAPDSWILMGALAIGALAGARLIIAARALRVGAGFIDAARALTWWAWILAGLWIPVLLYAEIWRADHLPGSLRYRGVWWSAVFPVGMFAAASSSTATVLGTRPLWTVSLVFCWMAVTLWLIVALGMVHSGSARWLRYRRDRHRHGRDQRPERQAPSAR